MSVTYLAHSTAAVDVASAAVAVVMFVLGGIVGYRLHAENRRLDDIIAEAEKNNPDAAPWHRR